MFVFLVVGRSWVAFIWLLVARGLSGGREGAVGIRVLKRGPAASPFDDAFGSLPVASHHARGTYPILSRVGEEAAEVGGTSCLRELWQAGRNA